MTPDRMTITEDQGRALAHTIVAEGRPDRLDESEKLAMMELQVIVPGTSQISFEQSAQLSRSFWREVANGALDVDGRRIAVLVSPLDAWRAFVPLAAWVGGASRVGRRGFLGVAGPPGVGKSVFAKLIVLAMKIAEAGEVVNLPMDGYHFPNEILRTHFAPGPAGTPVLMSELKGIPETFDSPALLADLRRLKEAGSSAELPAYSRITHDPVPRAIRAGSGTNWIVVEGNFLLLEGGHWPEIRGMFDLIVGLDAPDDLLRFRLAQRFQRSGRDPAWIQRHWLRVDGPNAERVRRSLAGADVIFETGLNWSLRPGQRR